jgi:hypothetical protein
MITVPIPFTHRFFEPEEVIISSCVHCFSTVAESDNEVVLDGLESLHSCSELLEEFLPEDLVASELLAAV